MSQDDPVIEVRGLSKSYQITHKTGKRSDTIKDSFANLLKHPISEEHGDKQETFWALDDVSFTVNKGEVFGIVGRNGSGKSTLLKILSRIVTPTKGTADLRGRTASLLEVGTGFHPELTGRENIYFNGSMLGMSRREIRKKFDEIVEFSEIEKFIDTPVKFYSSGMYVRLAFSVAAHLEPDILILDEVLAVGDASFQKKSLNKILDTMNDGRTVLFVSHSMGAVQQLCSRGVLLKNGKVDFVGKTEELVNRYNSLMLPDLSKRKLRSTWENNGDTSDDDIVPRSIFITDSENKTVTKDVRNDADHYLNIVVGVKKESENYTIGFSMHNQNNATVFVSAFTDSPDSRPQKMKVGTHTLICKIPKHFLNEGDYKIVMYGGVHGSRWSFEPENMTNPSVEYRINGGLSASPFWKVPRSGYAAPILDWKIKKGGS
ncbi:MAG: ABC transporter ATP-binding protein [Candidatus Saccharimonadales bacterium]